MEVQFLVELFETPQVARVQLIVVVFEPIGSQ